MESIFKTNIDGIIEEAFQKIGKEAQKSQEQITYDIHIAKFALMAMAQAFEKGLKTNNTTLILSGVSALSEFHTMKMAEVSYKAFMSILPGGKKTKPFDEINHPPKNKVNWQIKDYSEREGLDFSKIDGQQVVVITSRNEFKFGKVAESTGDGYCVLWQDSVGQINTLRECDIKAICSQDEFARANFSITEFYGI